MSNEFSEMNAATNPPAAEPKKRRGKKLWIALGLLVLLGAGTGGGAYAYAQQYQGKALPGTTVQGIDVAKKTPAEIEKSIMDALSQAKLEMKIQDQTLNPTWEELGVKVDAAAAAQSAVAKGSWMDYFKFNQTKSVAVPITIDPEAVTKYVDAHVPAGQQVGKPANVTMSEDGTKFDVTPSEPGKMPETNGLSDQVLAAAKDFKPLELNVPFSEKDPEFNTAKAEELAQAAQAQLDTKVTIKTPSYNYTPSQKRRASFIEITNKEGEAPAIKVNDQAITDWVGAVADDVYVSPRNAVKKVYPDGKEAAPPVAGREGKEVADATKITNEAIEAFKTGKETVIEPEIKSTPFKEVTKTIRPESVKLAYAPEDGEKWIDVNLSKHTATAYEGVKAVRGPVAMVNGAPKTPTVKGTFPIWLKRKTQTMRGPDYETPNVPWIMYFHGSYALHGAWWRSSFGYAGKNGSHGCINLPVGTAKWFYNWAPVGTKVVVHD
ncbi:hypothetical protein BK816_02825 [Boudabousia tangfeifanii]|uniref:L,D-TPase catalytic domain-containing protein n=1 Tax=Boudabousia tangfeifanii TaxID=1912795 RepID=A0A1D9MJ84_9ACTO|nr:L,D-transpeptidase [Boudabousia tangfeifanii]AOZ72365.1 hypothetical protein BK816_02825 [Boudabousia tangfeifanii]